MKKFFDTTTSSPNSWELIHNRNFMLLWGGMILSQIGDVIRYVALPAIIYQTTGSSVNIAEILMIGAVPSLLIAPLIGFLIDMLNRRHLLIVSNTIRGICSFFVTAQAGESSRA